MKAQKRRIAAVLAVVLSFLLFLFAGCALSPEETQRETEYYEQKYADEPEPAGDVARLLDVLDGCVGGQYIFAGQGNQVTHQFIDTMYRKYPDYFSDGRLEYLLAIADEAAANGHDYPEDYAWDCSGLWWYAASDVLNLYGTPTDRTAQDTYDDYCTPITKDELRPGDLVFVEGKGGKITHMGIVGRRGYIYEAVSGFCGVVLKRTIDKRVYHNIVSVGKVYVGADWNKFGRPNIFR
jgi:cell wall-associated NlpC family hydrolase